MEGKSTNGLRLDKEGILIPTRAKKGTRVRKMNGSMKALKPSKAFKVGKQKHGKVLTLGWGFGIMYLWLGLLTDQMNQEGL